MDNSDAAVSYDGGAPGRAPTKGSVNASVDDPLLAPEDGVLAASGATVAIARCDATERAEVQRLLLCAMGGGWPRLQGVWHAAGVLADCTLPAAYKKVALKKILTGKVRETFELWEADKLSFDDLLKRTKDLARARQLDTDVARGRSGVSIRPAVANPPTWGGGSQDSGGQEDVNAMNQGNRKKWNPKGGKGERQREVEDDGRGQQGRRVSV